MTLPAGYRGHDEIVSTVRARHGARSIGSTIEGNAIDALDIGAGRSLVLVIAGLHPLEWIGVETALALLDRVTLPGRRLVIVPVVNVDGYRAVEADVRAGRRRYRRGNMRGVDLNRNWPTGHRARKTHGRAPRSEPEVDAICRLVDDHVANGGMLDLAISLHSFGRKLLVPWGMRLVSPPAGRPQRTFASVVQARLAERYDVVQASRWLPGAFVRGCELDDFHGRYGARSLLVECSRGGVTRDPRTWITPFDWYNPADPAPIARDIASAIASACETIAW